MTQPDQLLELYHFEECPYCRKVRLKLQELEIDYISRIVDKNDRSRVEEVSDQENVPVLRDPNTGTIMPESDDIIEYLEENYA